MFGGLAFLTSGNMAVGVHGMTSCLSSAFRPKPAVAAGWLA
jgi:hypothetical protein